VEVVRRVMGITAEPKWGSMPNRIWDTNVWVADNRKIQSELGWRPQHTFEQGFCQMVNWFRDNPALHSLYFTRARAQGAK
jgi:dTDP-glucose 4,6-dehydratase